MMKSDGTEAKMARILSDGRPWRTSAVEVMRGVLYANVAWRVPS